MELTGRVAVVTGGTTGIGRAVAEALGRAGCRVAICARTEEDLEEAATSMARSGFEVMAVPTDVSREEEVGRFADHVRDELGPPDVLVNNAGIARFGDLDELTPADFDAVFGVNVRGLFLCSRAFAPGMAERGDGVIVNVASLAGKNAFPGGTVYAASKHAVMGMSKSMMLELREHGVRVLTICPGSVDTPFFDKQDRFDPDREKIVQPGAVAELVVSAVRLSDRGTVSEAEIRPVNP
jgi:3-oxoacyl-[acyl-carrier protein] reductase